MKDQRSPTHYLLRKVLFVLLLTGTLIYFTRIAMAQQEPNDRPRRPEGQDRGQGRGREGGGGGGGRREMAENKTPTSPNPGQTVGLFLNTPKACNG